MPRHHGGVHMPPHALTSMHAHAVRTDGALVRGFPMHGEYKVPGGKLVVADLEVDGGALARVSISGDFFLEPPEALARIDSALNGLDADAGEADIALAIARALPSGTEMFGFSPEAVAVAVRRALA
jgi:hypothetical protein